MNNRQDNHDSRVVPQINRATQETEIEYNGEEHSMVDSKPIYSRIKWEKNHYDLKYKYLAKYYIFNHYKFEDSDLKKREGTDEDENELKKVFKELNCIQGEDTFKDLRVKEVKEKLEKAAKGDYRDCAAVIVVVLSHGEEGILHAKDKQYDLKELWGPFLSRDASKDLIGKPKIFIIQACQGTTADPGTDQIDAKVDTSRKVNYPLFADFLFLFSSPPGNCAFRNATTGSWLIQTLCEGLREHHNDLDLQSIILLVKNHIACHKESYAPGHPALNKKKQMPYEASTLTKKFYLTENSRKKDQNWT